MDYQSNMVPRLYLHRKHADRPAFVYRLYDGDGAPLYVGVTRSWSSQMPVHAAKDDWFALVRSIQIEKYETTEECNARAAALYYAEEPPYNGPKRRCILDGDIVRIPLHGGECAVVDAADFEAVRHHTWSLRTSSDRKSKYVMTSLKMDGKSCTISLHRFLMNPPQGVLIDHKDGDSFNNRRCNLREATHTQNMANRQSLRNKESRYKGVRPVSNGRWRAIIYKGRQSHTIGTYDTEEEAAAAYDAKAVEWHGEFARLNLPGTFNGTFNIVAS